MATITTGTASTGSSWANMAAKPAVAPTIIQLPPVPQEKPEDEESLYKDVNIANLLNPNNPQYNPELAAKVKLYNKKAKNQKKKEKKEKKKDDASTTDEAASTQPSHGSPVPSHISPQISPQPVSAVASPTQPAPQSNEILGATLGANPSGFGSSALLSNTAVPHQSPPGMSPPSNSAPPPGFGAGGMSTGLNGFLPPGMPFRGMGEDHNAHSGMQSTGNDSLLNPSSSSQGSGIYGGFQNNIFGSNMSANSVNSDLLLNSFTSFGFDSTQSSFGGPVSADQSSFLNTSYLNPSATSTPSLMLRMGNVPGTKLRRFAMAYLGRHLLNSMRNVRSAVPLGPSMAFYPMVRISGQGEVFRGKLSNGAPVALKRLRKSTTSSIEEVKVLHQLADSCISKVYDYYVDADNFYIATVLYHGCLLDIIGDTAKPMPVADGLIKRPCKNPAILHDIVAQILSAVSFLHRKDIAHKSLKPHNVLFSQEPGGNLKIALSDAGIHRYLGSANDHYAKTSTGYMSRELTLLKLGMQDNPNWMPDGEAFKKADIFSLGLVCYFVMSGGMHPFSHPRRIKREADWESRIADGENPNLSHVTDPEAQHLFQLCLSHDPNRRPNASRLCGPNNYFKHPFFFSPNSRMQLIQSCEVHCSQNEGMYGLNLLENFVATSWPWKQSFAEVFDNDGTVGLGPNKGRVMYGNRGRDLIKFTSDVLTHYHELHNMSRLKTSLRNATISLGQNQDIPPSVVCWLWLKARSPLLWILMFEDGVTER